jgi:hypothetical protein
MQGGHDEWLEGLPESSIASFAGTGNPFRIGQLRPGEPPGCMRRLAWSQRAWTKAPSKQHSRRQDSRCTPKSRWAAS